MHAVVVTQGKLMRKTPANAYFQTFRPSLLGRMNGAGTIGVRSLASERKPFGTAHELILSAYYVGRTCLLLCLVRFRRGFRC